MSIKQLDLFHGAILAKIVRNQTNKISLIEWNEGEESGLYKIETTNSKEMSIFIKYATFKKSKPEKSKPEIEKWYFNNLVFKKNCCFCFVCIGETKEACLLTPDEVCQLFTDQEKDKASTSTSCVVSLKPKESFRVARKQKDIKFLVKRNAIDKI